MEASTSIRTHPKHLSKAGQLCKLFLPPTQFSCYINSFYNAKLSSDPYSFTFHFDRFLYKICVLGDPSTFIFLTDLIE